MTVRSKRRAPGEGGLYPRQDGKWEGRADFGYTPDGRRVRRRVVAATKREAAQRLAALMAERERGALPDASRWTVSAWLDHWVETAELRPRTRITYRANVRHLSEYLGRTQLRKLAPADVSRYMTARLSGEKPAKAQTVRNEFSALRRALEVARRHRLITENVCHLVSAPRVEREERQPLTPEEVRKFLAAAQGHPWEAAFVLTASTGLRRAEVLGLSWADVDLVAGSVRVERTLVRYDRGFHRDAPKTASSRRSIAIPPPVVEVLKRHRAQQVEERLRASAWLNEWDLVFVDGPGAPIEFRRLHDEFHALLKRAKVRRVRFHDLRHGAATYLLASGVPMKVVQEVLGHAQMSITADLYSHVLPELRRDAADRMGDVLFSS